jgi:hypothetical protein
MTNKDILLNMPVNSPLGCFFTLLFKECIQIRASNTVAGSKNDRKQIVIMNKVPPQAPEGDVKSGKRELLHFEVDGLGDGSNLHPL